MTPEERDLQYMKLIFGAYAIALLTYIAWKL